MEAVEALVQAVSLPPWYVALGSPAWNVRKEATAALGGLGERAPVEVVEALLQALSDPDANVRQAVAEALEAPALRMSMGADFG